MLYADMLLVFLYNINCPDDRNGSEAILSNP